MCAHASTSLYRKIQDLTHNDFVQPTALATVRGVVPIAVECFSASYSLIVPTEQVGSDKPVRSHLSTPPIARNRTIRVLTLSFSQLLPSLAVSYPEPPTAFLLPTASQHRQNKKCQRSQYARVVTHPSIQKDIIMLY